MKWNGSANMPVVAEYTSTDLTDWTGPTVVVEGNNPANFYECPDVFKIGDRTYLVYSEINGSDRKVHYLYKPDNGTWTVPTIDVLDGQGFYAGKTASDGTDRYIFGWCDRRSGNTNDGALAWGGSLVTHKLYLLVFFFFLKSHCNLKKYTSCLCNTQITLLSFRNGLLGEKNYRSVFYFYLSCNSYSWYLRRIVKENSFKWAYRLKR